MGGILADFDKDFGHKQGQDRALVDELINDSPDPVAHPLRPPAGGDGDVVTVTCGATVTLESVTVSGLRQAAACTECVKIVVPMSADMTNAQATAIGGVIDHFLMPRYGTSKSVLHRTHL